MHRIRSLTGLLLKHPLKEFLFLFFYKYFQLFIIALRLQNALITISVLYLARTYNMREHIYEGKRVYAVCLFFLVDLGG